MVSTESARFALNALQIGTWTWDIVGRKVVWSDGVESILGAAPGTFKGTYQSYLSFMDEADHPLLAQAIHEVFTGDETHYQIEHRVIWPNGERHWIEIRGRVHRDENKFPLLITGTMIDITPRKEAESVLNRRVNELQTVTEVSSAAATMLEPAHLLREVVQLTQHRFGLYHVHVFLHEPEKEALGIAACGWHENSPHHGTNEVRSISLRQSQSLVARSAREHQPIVVNRVHEDSTWLPNPLLPDTQAELAVPMFVGHTLIGVLDAQSEQPDYFTPETINVYGILASQIAIAIQNAYLHKNNQITLAQLKNAVQELEAKNAELERFTYTVSHDLKSPLITMRGFLGFLEKDAATGNMERFYTDLGRIRDATDKMQHLLEDLLHLSRVGRVVNPPLAVPFEEIAWEAVMLVTGRMVERGAQVSIAEHLPIVMVDKPRLVEVVQNLLDNAIKFMGTQPEPHVTIGMRPLEPTSSHPLMPTFFVCDNGIGIAQEYHEKIFGLFDKLDAHSEGTGVGLALVKRIIEMHSGQIWVESDGKGHGCCFCFTLPLAPSTT